jgi:hypothetical protein
LRRKKKTPSRRGAARRSERRGGGRRQEQARIVARVSAGGSLPRNRIPTSPFAFTEHTTP